MTAFNVVRMKVKAGFEKEFIELNKDPGEADLAEMRKNGFRRAHVIKTGDRTYCFIAEWDSFDGIVKSRAIMIRNLDRYRSKLEDQGSGLGITDPVSGEVVAEIG